MKALHVKKELLFIAAGWAFIFASAPLYIFYTAFSFGTDFSWTEVFPWWVYIGAFLLLFLVNHFLMVPKLIGRKLIWQYVVCVLAVVSLFVGFLRMVPVWVFPLLTNPMVERNDIRHESGPVERPFLVPEPNDENIGNERRMFERNDLHRHMGAFRRPLWLAPPDMARLVTALLMLGVDLGFIAWSNEQRMRQRLMLLEQQNLSHELQHLRYQINPHFFMNTLNNIHVLVDIDQERAKRAIVELSGLMRYALYEGNGSMVAIGQEIKFIRLYISLMKLRYSDKIDIRCEMPETVSPEVQILPMIFPTFIENAFKHGISCIDDSYIHVKISVEDDDKKVHFNCVNSRHEDISAVQDGYHGIGLENVRKRLDLQYADKYSLVINDQNMSQFVVDLIINV